MRVFRSRRVGIDSVREGMDRLGEFGVAAHAIAVAPDVHDVTPVEQRRGPEW